MSSAAIARVDIAQRPHASSARRAELAQRIDDSFAAHGVVLVEGHGLPDPVRRDARERARAFFALPTETKRRSQVEPGRYRGWIGTDAPAADDPTAPEHKEVLTFGPQDNTADRGWFARNRELHVVPGLDLAVSALFDAKTELLDDLVQLLDINLELGFSLVDVLDNPLSNLNVNFYPPSAPVHASNMRSHSDFGFLTIVDPDGVDAGLEVLHGDVWVPVVADRRSVVVLVGQLGERWTGGRWRACVHRVEPRQTGRGRISTVLFRAPHPETPLPVSAAPSAATCDHAPATTVGRHLMHEMYGCPPVPVAATP